MSKFIWSDFADISGKLQIKCHFLSVNNLICQNSIASVQNLINKILRKLQKLLPKWYENSCSRLHVKEYIKLICIHVHAACDRKVVSSIEVIMKYMYGELAWNLPNTTGHEIISTKIDFPLLHIQFFCGSRL